MKLTKTVRALLVTLALLCLAACSSKPTALEIDAKNGSYTNKKTGVVYVHAEKYYEAASVLSEREVARIKEMDDLILYEIEGADPAQMIASAELELFYAQGMTLPTLAEMAPNKIYVGQVGSGTTLDTVVATVTDTATIDSLISLYNTAIPFPEKEMLNDQQTRTRYNLRFASSAHPAFYYCLTYWRFAEDVLVYEVIDSREGFVPTYTGDHVTVSFEEDGGELCAVYNFGKYIVYDRVLRECYAVGQILEEQMN